MADYVWRVDLMDVGDVPFVLGPLFGPFVAVIAAVVITVMKRSASVLVLAWMLAAIVLVSSVTYWYAWGLAFDDADANRPISSNVEAVSNATIAVSAAGVLGLLVLLLLVVTDFRRTARQ